MFIVNGWTKGAEIDDYEDGCIGNYSLVGGHNDTFPSEDIDTLLEKLKSFTGHAGIETNSEGEVSIQGLENGEGYPATEREIEQWKKGEVTLWSVCYTFFVYEASLYNFGE